MRFVKLRLQHVPNKGVLEAWHLIIDNLEDLKKYHGLEAKLYMQSLFNMAKSSKQGQIETTHLFMSPAKEKAIGIMLRLEQESLAEGEEFSPIVKVAQMVDSKMTAMARHILMTGPIQVNPVGGWCGVDAYMRTWDAEVIQTIEKDDPGFPVEADVLKCKTLILENSHHEMDWQNSYVKKNIPDHGEIGIIRSLKETDFEYVKKCIINAEIIMTSTQAVDSEQLTGFMKLFSALPKKSIWLICSEEAKDRIISHPLYEENAAKHEIHFRNPLNF